VRKVFFFVSLRSSFLLRQFADEAKKKQQVEKHFSIEDGAPASASRGLRDASYASTRCVRTPQHHPVLEFRVRIVNVVCCLSFSRPARDASVLMGLVPVLLV